MMASNNRDKILSNFIAITQCSSKQATECLESTNWNEQAALDFFYDSGIARIPDPVPSTQPKPNQNPSNTTGYDSDDDLLQSALEESLRFKAPEKSPVVAPKRIDPHKSIISSNINTFDRLKQDVKDNSDDDDDDGNRGQAFYAGGSEQSGQQIIGPPRGRNNDKNVKQIFDAARKQGATEAHDDNSASSSHKKQEKPFTGAGYSLGDSNTRPNAQGQTPSGPQVEASNVVEQVPIRFYSNGFTVGDGELRKFEENREFMEYIKRGETPPEFRNTNKNGKQIEIHLEDHRHEEYKRVAPAFKPFGGTGHTVGLPGTGQGQIKSSTATPLQTTSPDASRLEQLAEKRLKTSPLSTTIRLRLPDLSQPICIKIDLNRTLADVRRFLNENVPSLQSNTFEFMEPPSTKIKRDDERKKISDGNLANSTLAVRRIA